MRIYGRASVAELLGDFIVYRNLLPMDPRLPSLEQIRSRVGLLAGTIPRKSDLEYARVMAHYLRAAHAIVAGSSPLQRFIFIGDTHLNDGTAAANLAQVSGWPGLTFIGSEKSDPATVEVRGQGLATFYLANRWALLYDFDIFCLEQGHPIDEHTVVVLDLDKTTVGARGRNDRVIDAARIEAVRVTVDALLGADFDPEGFRRSYDLLNQPAFHPFTADNQDYLAYICLMIGCGLVQLDTLVARVEHGELRTFMQFLQEVDAKAAALPAQLQALHVEILDRTEKGDPTPFKQFRFNEYRQTAARFGCLPDTADVAEMLKTEIVITQEVREMSLAWKARGALLFGLSDKPDEASIPSESLLEQGYQPIHRLETHAVGLEAR